MNLHTAMAHYPHVRYPHMHADDGQTTIQPSYYNTALLLSESVNTTLALFIVI